MPMSLRVNRKKKELFEAEAPRSSKRLKTDHSTPTSASPRSQKSRSGFSSPKDSVQSTPSIFAGTYPHSVPQSGVPPSSILVQNVAHTPNHSAPRRSSKQTNPTPNSTGSLLHDESSLPVTSAVPSLDADIDTSDDSLSSQSEKLRPITYALAEQEAIKSVSDSKVVQTAEPGKSASGGAISQSIAATNPVQQFILETATPGDEISPAKHLLDQTCKILEEMETGQFLPIGRQKKAMAARHSTQQQSRAPHRRSSKETRNLPDSLPTNPPSLDTEMVSVITGIISELATGVNHGHGIAYLAPNVAQHQFVHRQRFIDCLTAFITYALPQVNTFVLDPEDVANLLGIYKRLERRLPLAELPPPTPPPGHMVVRHSMPHYPLQLMNGEMIPASFAGPVLPSNAPPEVKVSVAPKRRSKGARHNKPSEMVQSSDDQVEAREIDKT